MGGKPSATPAPKPSCLGRSFQCTEYGYKGVRVGLPCCEGLICTDYYGGKYCRPPTSSLADIYQDAAETEWFNIMVLVFALVGVVAAVYATYLLVKRNTQDKTVAVQELNEEVNYQTVP